MRLKNPSITERIKGALSNAWTKATGGPKPSKYVERFNREGPDTTTRSTQTNMKAAKGLTVMNIALTAGVAFIAYQFGKPVVENLIDNITNTEQSTPAPDLD